MCADHPSSDPQRTTAMEVQAAAADAKAAADEAREAAAEAKAAAAEARPARPQPSWMSFANVASLLATLVHRLFGGG